MQTILLNDILASTNDLSSAGAAFYDRICDFVKESTPVLIDMRSVTSLPSIFLNVSIGRIIDEYGMDSLRHTLSFSNITKAQAERLKQYLSNYSA